MPQRCINPIDWPPARNKGISQAPGVDPAPDATPDATRDATRDATYIGPIGVMSWK
jgi:hypothetical protein